MHAKLSQAMQSKVVRPDSYTEPGRPSNMSKRPMLKSRDRQELCDTENQ